VGVEVRAVLAFPVDQKVIAVEDRVVAGFEDLAVADGYKWGVAGGDYVEALVGAAAIAGSAECTYRSASAVGALDGKDVAVIGEAAIG
jgi:hypothetical protein